jgi:hypothetical protein
MLEFLNDKGQKVVFFKPYNDFNLIRVHLSLYHFKKGVKRKLRVYNDFNYKKTVFAFIEKNDRLFFKGKTANDLKKIFDEYEEKCFKFNEKNALYKLEARQHIRTICLKYQMGENVKEVDLIDYLRDNYYSGMPPAELFEKLDINYYDYAFNDRLDIIAKSFLRVIRDRNYTNDIWYEFKKEEVKNYV